MKSARFILLAMIITVSLVLLSPLASDHPDGLERVLEDHAEQAESPDPMLSTPLADYELAGAGGLGTVAAGAIGVVLTLAVGLAVGRLLARRPAKPGTAQRES